MGTNEIEMHFADKKSLKQIVNSVISTLTSEKGIETYHLHPPKSATEREIEISAEYNSVEDKITELELIATGYGEKNFPTLEELYHLALTFGNSNRYFDMNLTQELNKEIKKYEHKTITEYLTLRRVHQFVNPYYFPTTLDLHSTHNNKYLFLQSNNKVGDHTWKLALTEKRPQLFAEMRMKAINEYFGKYLAQGIPCTKWDISWTS